MEPLDRSSQGVPPLTNHASRVGPLEKDLTRAGGGEESGRLWAAESIVFYVSGRLWEAHYVVFYEVLRLPGGPASNEPCIPGGSAREGPYACGGRGRVWEALGG